MYHHGTPENFSVYSINGVKLTLSCFTDDPDKREVVNIRERDKLSILTRTFDKDHNEVFTIYRGLVKEISTELAKSNMSTQGIMQHIMIKMDCSGPNSSNIQYIKLYDIVEVHEIDYEYEALVRKPITVQEEPISWKVIDYNGNSEVDLTSVISLIS